MLLSKSITKLVWQFMSGNFLSKVSGLIRDVTMAFFFGADAVLAAFIISYRSANLLRRLFGEGALVAGFIPHFESLKVESEKKAFSFFKVVTSSMILFLIGICCIIELGILVAPKYLVISSDVAFILKMTAIMFPSILFICLYGIYSGVLQSYKKFFQTSIAPVVFNFSWVIVMILSKHLDKKTAMIWLSWGVLLGFVLQFGFTQLQVWQIQRNVGCEKGLKISWSKNMKPLFASLAAGVIGVGATQINNVCDVIFARMASLEGPAHLTYGMRIQQLPLSVFVVALSSVILPQLSRSIKLDQKNEFIEILQSAVYRTFFILVPISFMCFLLGGSFVNVIYGRGGFDQFATVQTTYCLFAYSIGMLPMGLVILLAPAFYAQKDYKITTLASCVSVLVNLSLNGFFVNLLAMRSASVAYATSIAAFVNIFLLGMFLRKKIGDFLHKQTLIQMCKIIVCALIAFLIQAAIDYYIFQTPSINLLFGNEIAFPRNLMIQLIQFFGGCSIYIILYLSLCQLLKVEGVELFSWKKNFSEKKPISNS